MTSRNVMEALGGSVLGAELKGDLAAAEMIAAPAAESDSRARPAAALDLALVQLLKGDLTAARASLERSRLAGLEEDGQELRCLTFEDLCLQLQYNCFPSGIGAGSVELASRWDAAAHADWLGDRWGTLFQVVRGTPAALEALVLHRLPALLLSVRAAAISLGQTGGDRKLVAHDGIQALLGLDRDGVSSSYRAYSRRAAAMVLRDAGDLEQATALLDSAIDAYSDVGDRVGKATCLTTRGDWLAAPFSSPLLLDLAPVESSSEGSDLDWGVEAREARRHEVDVASALRSYSEADAALAGASAPRAHAALTLRLSYLAVVQNDFEQAVDLAEAARRGFLQSGDRYGEHVAMAHSAHGRVGAGDLPEQVRVARAIGDWGRTRGSFSYALGIGLVFGRAGRHWLLAGDYERALACYRLAQGLYETLRAPFNEIQSIVDQGKAYAALGEHATAGFFLQQALDRSASALALRPDLDRPLRRERRLIEIRYFMLALRQRDPDAMERAAAALREGLESDPVDSRLQRLLGLQGSGTRAEEEAVKDAVVALTAQEHVEQSGVLIPLYQGQQARDAGRRNAAERSFEEALSAARALESPAQAFLEPAVLATMRDHGRAREAFLEAQAKTQADADARVRLNMLQERASFLTRVGAYSEARDCFAELERLVGAEWWKSDDRPWTGPADQAEVCEGLQDFEGALRSYERAIEALESRGRLLSRDELRTALAGDRTAQHLYFQAARAALRAAEERDDPSERASLHARGFAFGEQGKARALLDLMAGSAAMSARASAEGSTIRSWRQANAEVTVARALLAEARSRQSATGRTDAERALIERLERQVEKGVSSLARIEARLTEEDPKFLSTVNPRAPVMSLEAVSATLDSETVILQYLFLGTDFLAWAVTREGLARFEHAVVDEGRLTFLIDAVRRGCEDGSDGWQAPALDLSEALLVPFAREIDAHSRLVVVPYGAGHELPFQVLPLRGEPLVASHEISILPSASTLQFLPRDGKVEAPTVLAVGNPANMAYRAPGGFSAEPQKELAGAAAEAEWVASALPGSKALVGAQATEANVRSLIGRHDILHFATHGVLERSPLLSSILLADGQSLTVYELLGMELTAELVVLSGCRTGQGAATGGDEVVGLTRALLAGGAKGAIVSLWPVDDLTTSIFMRAFYEKLGNSPAAALRHAQQHVRDLDPADWRREAGEVRAGVSPQSRHLLDRSPSTRDTSHPYYWAPFIFVGAPALDTSPEPVARAGLAATDSGVG